MSTFVLSRILLAAFVINASLTVGVARSHFVWVAVEPRDGKPSAAVWFGEMAEPGEAELLERVSHSRLRAKFNDGVVEGPTLERRLQGTVGAWVAPLKKLPQALVVECDYGVIKRDGEPFRLIYLARYIDRIESAKSKPAELPLAFDIQPSIHNDELVISVTYNGKPAGRVEIVAYTPGYDEVKGISTEAGDFKLGKVEPGRWAIRAKHVLEGAGTHNEKSFAETRTYTTLTLEVPESDEVSNTADDSKRVVATKLLKQARDARAIWHNFPGATAQLEIRRENQVDKGVVKISADGKVTLDEFSDNHRDVIQDLNSLVAHRLPGNDLPTAATLSDEATLHPLGKLVTLDKDTRMASAYRIDNDVVRQVNRTMGGGKFCISVLDVARNNENKYLPTAYCVTLWNKDFSLKSVTTIRESWTRVGEFDLPVRRFSVTSRPQQIDYVELIFSDYRLGTTGE